MMRILFILLGLLLVAVALGWVLQQSTGEVVFSYQDWTLRTSLLIFAVVAALLFLLAYVVLRALTKLLRAPAELRRWSALRRQRRAQQLLNQGVLAMLEGDWRNAERAFSKGAPLSRAPLVNYLGAAQAAYRQGDADRCDHYLGLARRYDDADSPVLRLTQARLQIDRQQAQQADETLSSLGKKHEQATSLLLEVAITRKDWSRATGLVRAHNRRGTIPAQRAGAEQLAAGVELLRRAGAEPDAAALEEVWRGLPNRLQKENTLIAAYVRERLRHGDDRGCENLLRRALKRKWDEELLRLFGLVQGRTPKAQLAFAERLLAQHPEDAALLLTLGRLCRNNHLWGKAVNYLEQSVRIKPDPIICRELATLLEQQGDHARAQKYCQQGLELATADKLVYPQRNAEDAKESGGRVSTTRQLVQTNH